MQANRVVKTVDVLCDRSMSVLLGRIRLCRFLGLQCSEEAFRDRVIPAISLATHAGDHAECAESVAEIIPGPKVAFSSSTQGGSRVPESGPLGFVRGACSNACPYRDLRGDVRVDAGEVELAGDEEDDGADGAEAPVSSRLALGGLEQAVDRLEEPIGLARINPGEDAIEVLADHGGHVLHRLDLRAQHVAAPAVQESRDNGGLLGDKAVAQLLTIVPGTSGAGAGHASEELIELGAPGAGELAEILQCGGTGWWCALAPLIRPSAGLTGSSGSVSMRIGSGGGIR